MSLNNKIQLLQLYNYIDILFDTCDYNNIREFIDDELIEPKNKFSDELLQYIIRKLIYVKNPKSNELLKYIYKITFIYLSRILIGPFHTHPHRLIRLLPRNLFVECLQVPHLLHHFNLHLLFGIHPLLKPHVQLLTQ